MQSYRSDQIKIGVIQIKVKLAAHRGFPPHYRHQKSFLPHLFTVLDFPESSLLY